MGIDQQHELVVDRRDLIAEPLLGAWDRRDADPVARDPPDALDVVDDQAERPVAEREHHDLSAVARMGLTVEPAGEVGDRHHHAAKADHPSDEPAGGGGRRQTGVADDLAHRLDRHGVLLAVQGENHELSLGDNPSILANRHIGV